MNAKKPEELLLDYADGNLGKEGTERLEAWIAEDEKNKDILRATLDLNMKLDALDIMDNVDSKHAFGKVKSTVRKNRRTRAFKRIQAVAALLTIPLAIALTAVSTSNKPEAAEDLGMLEFKVNPGMTASVTLPDGTQVMMNSGSSIKYPSSFKGMEERKIEFEGEGYFEVAKDSDHIFEVNLFSGDKVRVYGTCFNLEAYPSSNVVATLVEGSIGFVYEDAIKGTKEIQMTPNHRLEHNTDSGILSVRETHCISETAWKNGKILLDSTPIKDILHILSKRYDVDFIVSNNQLYDMTFSGGMVKMNRLERLLDSFSISSSMHWKYLPDDNSGKRPVIEIY